MIEAIYGVDYVICRVCGHATPLIQVALCYDCKRLVSALSDRTEDEISRAVEIARKIKTRARRQK